jgi:apoptosis-inducing factor 2
VHNVAAIRAVADPSWLDSLILPYDRLLAHGRVSGVVLLRDGSELAADDIVLAIGSSYPAPFKAGSSTSEFAATVRAVNARLRASQSVVVTARSESNWPARSAPHIQKSQ